MAMNAVRFNAGRRFFLVRPVGRAHLKVQVPCFWAVTEAKRYHFRVDAETLGSWMHDRRA